MTTREAYEKAGGHAAVKDSLHDGIKLPRAYRLAGLMTDVCDATELGAPALIWVWSILLLGGHVLPYLLLTSPGTWRPNTWVFDALPMMAVFLSYLTRFACAVRYQQSYLGAALHPVGILILLAIQWYATVRVWVGRPVGWKGRSHPAHTSRSSAAA
jgi:hypothetical protein